MSYPIYDFSNENLLGMFADVDFRDKTVLAVCSSGDYAFDAYLRGAKRVDTFDKNAEQRGIMELKFTMIKHLRYQDFKNCFFNQDFKYVEKIKNKLTPYAFDFYENQRTFGYKRLIDYPRLVDEPWNNIAYLQSEENYNKLAKLLPDKIRFEHVDLLDIPQAFYEKYDIILLSNIYDYICVFSEPQENMWRVYKNVLMPLARHNICDDGGQIFCRYVWGSVPDFEQMQTLQQRASVFNKWRYPELEHSMCIRQFSSVLCSTHGQILDYKKRLQDYAIILKVNKKSK